MIHGTYLLPEISFVGGESQDFIFYLKTPQGESFDMEKGKANFAICNYSDKTGTPRLSYTPSIAKDENGIFSILKVSIPKTDTVRLCGKFIYQITLIDQRGISEIPDQGIMNITKNINQGYILPSD